MHSGRQEAFTLMELLTVISIIAILGGLSIGAFQTAQERYELEAAIAEIQTVLRGAKNTSTVTGTASVVDIRPTRQLVQANRYETIGEWSFEDYTSDSDSESDSDSDSEVLFATTPKYEVRRAVHENEGRIGSSFNFATAGSHIDCGSLARFDITGQIRIEAWVRHVIEADVTPPEDPDAKTIGLKRRKSTPQERYVIVEKKGAYSFLLTKDRGLEGRIGDYRIRTESRVVPSGTWVFVAMEFDGTELRLSVGGVDRPPPGAAKPSIALRSKTAKASTSIPSSIPRTEAPLTISCADTARSFPGSIDEIKLRGQVEPMSYRLAEHLVIVGFRKKIHFDRHGRLDAGVHDGPVKLTILELPAIPESGVSTTIDFSMTFAEWRERQSGKRSRSKLRVAESPTEEIFENRVIEKLMKDPEVRRRDLIVDRLGVVR